jgi:hypothetical protein
VNRKILFFGISMALWAASASAGGIDLVANGGFTTGDFTGWTTNTCSSGCSFAGWSVTGIITDAGAPSDTGYAAYNGCTGASCNDPVSGDWISQPLATGASQTYTLTFFFDPGASSEDDGGGGIDAIADASVITTTELDVLWDGSLVTGGQIVNATSSTWEEYTFTGLTASTTSTVLEFTGREDPDYLQLTDISVTADASPTVPEPASLTLIGGGLLGMICTVLRRRRKA